MKDPNLQSINDEADFLAHAEALVHESMERYEQLADSMEMHHNPDAATQFRHLESTAKKSVRHIEEIAAGLPLPEIAPWDFQWHCPDDPDSDCLSGMDYLMSPAGALIAALHNESRIETFYRGIVEQSRTAGVRKAAGELAEYQLQQIAALKQRLGTLARDAHESAEDLDPPNVPD